MSAGANWEQQVADNARRYQALQDQLAQRSVTETSRDGLVHVTVSATGVLTELVLKEPWQPRPMAHVAAEVMACVRRAQARIPELLRQAINGTVGAEDAAAALIVADARQRFPEPPPTDRGKPVVDEMAIGGPGAAEPPPQPAARPMATRRTPVRPARPSTEDDDWDQGSIMDDV